MKRYILFAVILICLVSGCGDREKGVPKKEDVVARINNYELTAGDFRDETRIVAPDIYRAMDSEKAKEDALDKLITKKILLQEAQALNLDKDGRFMKEIERYWEQALLKLLINRKIGEFSKQIPPDTAVDLRQKMLQAELSGWIASLRNSAKIRVYKENLKKVEIK